MSAHSCLIVLEPFTADDIDRLIGWIPTQAFLLQWAGPSYDYPLTRPQVQELLDISNTPDASHRLYRVANCLDGEVIGHCELLNIDRDNRLATLGRVLVGPPQVRGSGLGGAIVRAALDIAFDELALHRIGLGVFDFNAAAIACYERVGFQHEGTLRDYRRIGDAYWNLRMMSILEAEWRAVQRRDVSIDQPDTTR